MNARKEDCYDGPMTDGERENAPWYPPPRFSRRDLEIELGVPPDEDDKR